MNTMKLKTKKALITILADRLFPALDSEEKDTREDYRIIGDSDEQATDWRTGELKFNDDGEPIMEKKWGYVQKTQEELTEDDIARLAAIETLRTALEKLI